MAPEIPMFLYTMDGRDETCATAIIVQFPGDPEGFINRGYRVP